MLLPLHGQPFQAKFSGPYVVEKRLGELNYVIATPDQRKTRRLCHVNMLKAYIDKTETRNEGFAVNVVAPVMLKEDEIDTTLEQTGSWEDNSERMENLSNKLSHLTVQQKGDLFAVLRRHQEVFRDTPGLTDLAEHDVDVGDACPLKLPPYRVSPQKAALLQQEIEYMMKHGLIEPCQSEWSSPVILVSKPDGTYRFCVDYRRVNKITKTDTFPLPRVDDCVDKVGKAKYITKFDLLNGYWQVPLSNRAREVSSFVVNGAQYYRIGSQYYRME